jgi:hypothetical protein
MVRECAPRTLSGRASRMLGRIIESFDTLAVDGGAWTEARARESLQVLADYATEIGARPGDVCPLASAMLDVREDEAAFAAGLTSLCTILNELERRAPREAAA